MKVVSLIPNCNGKEITHEDLEITFLKHFKASENLKNADLDFICGQF